MALNKELVLETGFICKYHKIDEIVINNSQKAVTINFMVWKDEESRREDKKFGIYLHVRIDNGQQAFDDFFALDPNPVNAGYKYLKSLPEFEGSQDV